MKKHNGALLGSASALTLALAIAGQPAHAASTNQPDRTSSTGTVTSTGQFAIDSYTANPTAGTIVDATVSGNTVSSNQTATGVNTPSNTTVGSNLIGAFATGNDQTAVNNNQNSPGSGLAGNQIVLTTTSPVSANGTGGAAILSVSYNNGTTVRSTATNNAFTATATGVSTESLQNVNNTITAQALLNSALNRVSGDVPTALDGATGANGTISSPTGGPFAATGGIVVTNIQTNTAPGATSAATLGNAADATLNNRITLNVTNTGANPTITGNLALTGNTLSAIFQGNNADNGARLTPGAGGGANLNASVAVTNSQANTGLAATNGANNYDSLVSATINGPTTLQTAMGVSNNTISAASIGNNAFAPNTGATTIGNVITIADGVNVATPATRNGVAQPQANTFTGIQTAASTGTVNADLAVLSQQLNDGGAGGGALGTTTSNGQILATVRGLAAPLNVTQNAITADTNGNRAFNAILVGPTAAGVTPSSSITGPVGLGSVQTNNNMALSATNTGGQVSVQAARTAGDTLTGPVSVNANTISATTLGNNVVNQMSLAGNAVSDLSGTPSTASGSLTGGTPAAATGSAATGTATVNTVQTNLGGSITTNTTTPLVQLLAGSAGTPSTNAGLTTNGNVLAATGMGNLGRSGLSLAGQSGTAAGALVNQQTSNAPVAVNLTNPQVTLTGFGSTFTNPVVGASNNTLQALGYSNNATNTLGETIGVFQAGAPGGAAFTNATGLPVVNGGLALLSNQSSGANVTANAVRNVAGSAINIGLSNTAGLNDAAVTGGTITASRNDYIGAAIANSVVNTASLNSTSLSGASGGTAATPGPSIAAIGNVQTVGANAITGTASTLAANNVLSVGMGAVNSSTVAVLGNRQTGIATGNEATNTLTTTATSLTAATAAATAGATPTGTSQNGAAVTTAAALSITNLQTSAAGGTRVASVSGSGIGINLGTLAGTQVSQSAVTVDDATVNGVLYRNAFQALATDNTATNLLNGVGAVTPPVTTFNASAAVQNVQTSAAGVSSTVGTGTTANPIGVRITTGDVNQSAVTLNDIVFRAASVGNAVVNGLGVSATNANGGGTPTAGAASFADGGARTANGELALANIQNTTGGGGVTITARTDAQLSVAGIGANPGLAASTLAVTNNNILATADANTAVNTLGTTTGATLGNVAVGQTPAAQFGSALLNVQGNNETVSATVGTAAGSFTFGVVNGANATLANNNSLAQARANTATNTAGELAGTVGTGNVGLASQQTNSGGVTATGTMNLAFSAGTSATNARAVMDGNLAQALAGGNTVANTVTAGAGTNRAVAQYALVSVQNNSGAIAATENNANLSLSSGATTTGSTLINTNNRVRADGYANYALNSIGVSALPSGNITAALTSNQVNTGNVTAQVNNSVISNSSLGLSGGNILGVTNNRIVATATGNLAGNTISALPR